MDEENKMMEETLETETTEENSDNETGSPIGLILAGCGVVAGGLVWLGRKVFKRKKYTEVIHHGRFGKE